MVSVESLPRLTFHQLREGLWPWIFWVVWLCILLVEALALSLAVDTNIPSISNHPQVMVRLVSWSSSLLRLGICVGTVMATVLLFSSRFRKPW